MKTYKETSIKYFDFWSNAADTVAELTHDELDTIELILEYLNPDGMSETDLNDFFWFEDDLIAEWLGYNSFEEIIERNQ